MDRISSGIPGLDEVIGGGYIKNTVNGILGGSGTGKTIFGIQFLLNGIHHGQDSLYISMEEEEERLIAEAESMGFLEIRKLVEEKKLMFKQAGAKKTSKFMREILPSISGDYDSEASFEKDTRIFIDPLTPILWEIKDKSQQRELISESFAYLRDFSTTLVSIEESPTPDEREFTEETAIPIYLSDSIIRLRYVEFTGEQESRILRIQKFRSSDHGEDIYPFNFIPGLGIIVLPQEEEVEEFKTKEEEFDAALQRVEKAPPELRDILIARLKKASENWTLEQSPKKTLDSFLKSYSL